jgi:hypothetical protein
MSVEVSVGDIWEFVGEDFNPPIYRSLRASEKRKGDYKVVKANINTEAGPDSWVMCNIETGRTLYMHHRCRMAGDWVRKEK